MHRPEDLTWLAPISELVDADTATRHRWVNLAASALTPQTLFALEQLTYTYIDLRYPDDPGSLLNRPYREGQRLKKRLRKVFAEAHERLTEQFIEFFEQARELTLGEHLAAMADALYLERRGMTLRRQDDELAFATRASLAYNDELQAELAREEQQHRHRRADTKRQHRQAVDLRRVEAEIAGAQRALDRPHELVLKLYDVLKSMAEYQMTLADRASRNPALADRLRMMNLGLTTVMASVQGLIAELNSAGPNQPTPEQLREQSAQILALAMEQMQQWQQEIRQEPGT